MPVIWVPPDGASRHGGFPYQQVKGLLNYPRSICQKGAGCFRTTEDRKMKTIFAILMMCFTGFAFADGHLAGEEGHHAETEAGSGDHSAHGADTEEGDEDEGEDDEGKEQPE